MKNILLSLTFFLPFLVAVQAQNSVVVESKHGFSETVEQLKQSIKAMDLKIISEVPHSKGAEMSGLELAPTHLLIFGNPKVGSQLMQKDQGIGLDLPLRMLIYQKDGTTYVSYHDPRDLAEYYDLGGKAKILSKMNQAVSNIAKTVAK
jgi:uncharacterized protein (DUF302 family)